MGKELTKILIIGVIISLIIAAVTCAATGLWSFFAIFFYLALIGYLCFMWLFLKFGEHV